jgi:uncharacterized protein YfaS (alpha-2-macroglobulin family)
MGTIYGVALHEGKPAEGVEVRLLGEGGDLIGEARTSEDGAFTFEVAAGTWNLEWSAPGGEKKDGQVEVPEGEDAEVELEV